MIEPIYLQQLPKTLHKLKKNLYSDPQIRKQTNRPEGLEITTVLRKGYEGAVRLDVLFKISRKYFQNLATYNYYEDFPNSIKNTQSVFLILPNTNEIN